MRSYIDTVDALNKKESASRANILRLKQDLDNHSKELNSLRNLLNCRKADLDQETEKSHKLEKDLLESRTAHQLLKGKYEALERRFKEEKVRWEEEAYNQEAEVRKNESLLDEIENLRKRLEKSDAEMSRLRIEIGRLKEEEKMRNSLSTENFNQNSSGSNKRELLDEIEKKNIELQAVLIELRNKQGKIEDLNTVIEEMSTKLRLTEKDLMIARSNSQSSNLAILEPFNQTSPVNLNSSRPSLLQQNSHQSSASQLLVQQKEGEIMELKHKVADLKKDLEEKNIKLQGLIGFFGDSESRFGEKERKLEQKVEAKEAEISSLRKEMIDREEEACKVRNELEEKLRYAEFDKENTEELIKKLQHEIGENNQKLPELLSTNQRLLNEISQKDAEISRLSNNLITFEQNLKAEIYSLQKEISEKNESISRLKFELGDCKRKEDAALSKISEVRALEEQIEFLNQQQMKAASSLRRYQDISNQIYCYSIKCDTVYKGGLTIFVKYARAVYIPLVFNYHPSMPSIGEITKETSVEVLESYCHKIKKLQEQVCCVSFVLDMTTISPKIKKLLEANSMVAVCRVEDVVQEKVDLKTNKELVSFVQAGVVYKVIVEEVVCLMSASFDNAIDLGEFKQMESGAQNKTFQY